MNATTTLNPGQTKQFATPIRAADGYVWNGTAYVAWTAAAAILGAMVFASNGGNTGLVAIPAGVLSGGDYLLPCYLYAGGSPATGDLTAVIGYAGVPDATPTTGGIVTGTAQAGTSSTITLAASLTIPTGSFVGQTIQLTGGTGVGQIAQITAWNETTKVATITTALANNQWVTTPDSTTTYSLPGIEWGSTPIAQWEIVDATGAPVDLTGLRILFTAWLSADGGVTKQTLFQHDNAGIGGITISGASNNVVSMLLAAADTASIIQDSSGGRYDLWSISSSSPPVKLPLSTGSYIVGAAE